MVWNEFLERIKTQCENAAIIGIQTGLAFTTSNRGLKLNGKETVSVVEEIKKAIDVVSFDDEEKKKTININKTLIIEEVEYTYSKYDYDDGLIYMISKEYNSTIVLGPTKMVVIVACLSDDIEKSLFAITDVLKDLRYRGL